MLNETQRAYRLVFMVNTAERYTTIRYNHTVCFK